MRNEFAKKCAAVCFWLAVWQAVSVLTRNSVLLVGPYETLLALARLIASASFWKSVLATSLRILCGFAAGCASGILLAWLSYRTPFFRTLLAPPVTAMKAVPVVSFVILLLIRFGSPRLSFFIALIVTLPILYTNTLEGLSGTDRNLLEMASVFRMRLPARLAGIYIPHVSPYIRSGLALAVGTSWKAGIAAEVIGQPLGTLGNDLYRAKILLETDTVLAVTVTAVFLSWLFETLLLRLVSERKRGAE